MFKSTLLKERDRLALLADNLIVKIKKFPDGDLLCSKNGKSIKYQKSNGCHPIYLYKSERDLVKSLAIKKYYSAYLNDIVQEINILNQAISGYDSAKFTSESLLEPSSNYHKILSSYFHSFPDHIQKWINEKYDYHCVHPEFLIHKTLRGDMVRSKSEVIIANALYNNKIPYRYECPFKSDNFLLFPDFTIMHPTTMDIYYWEHFGMMDISEYHEKAFNKLKNYASVGIIPSINLITTYETNHFPINSEKIQSIIAEFFL